MVRCLLAAVVGLLPLPRPLASVLLLPVEWGHQLAHLLQVVAPMLAL